MAECHRMLLRWLVRLQTFYKEKKFYMHKDFLLPIFKKNSCLWATKVAWDTSVQHKVLWKGWYATKMTVKTKNNMVRKLKSLLKLKKAQKQPNILILSENHKNSALPSVRMVTRSYQMQFAKINNLF